MASAINNWPFSKADGAYTVVISHNAVHVCASEQNTPISVFSRVGEARYLKMFQYSQNTSLKATNQCCFSVIDKCDPAPQNQS